MEQKFSNDIISENTRLFTLNTCIQGIFTRESLPKLLVIVALQKLDICYIFALLSMFIGHFALLSNSVFTGLSGVYL